MKKKFFKQLGPVHILAIITAILMAVGVIVFRIEPLRFLPLFVSIAVMFLQTSVNRFAFLLGGFNCLLYTVANLSLTLYASALSALLFSFPIQLVTFFNWKRHTQQGRTVTRRFSVKGRILLLLGMAAAWVVLYLIFVSFGSEYLLLDNTGTVIGAVSTFLCLLRYSECAIFQLISTAITIVLYTVMTMQDPSMIIWLIFSIYSIICSCFTFAAMNKQATA